MLLNVDNLDVRYGPAQVLHEVTLTSMKANWSVSWAATGPARQRC